ncbi:MAG: hypothetical protein E6R03_15220 [Hyphomicrobiaceae bacterium]|nr:MAG: hypothetical protein E6R03_15220 [Hyphomicrobiaceae bacterium]
MMAELTDIADVVQRKAQKVLSGIDDTRQDLVDLHKLLHEIGNDEGLLSLRLVGDGSDQGTRFEMPALLVRRYLESEIERLSNALREQIEPLRYLLEQENDDPGPQMTPIGEMLVNWLGANGTQNAAA